MKIRSTRLKGLAVVETESNSDLRGSFSRLFCMHELSSFLNGREIVQINHSRTISTGVIRGLHFQFPPRAEMKMVRCLKGRVWDVAVDIRRGSDTYLMWHAEELSPTNGRMMMIGEGFAHGFQVLESDSELLYQHTNFYAPDLEGGIRYDDPAIGILWPLPVAEISPRDLAHPLINPNYFGVTL